MKKGRMKRNLIPILISLFVFIVCLVVRISPKTIKNYTDIMNGIVSFSSMATALFFAIFSLIPSFSNSRIIIALKELNTDKKYMDRLLIATVGFLISAIIAFFELLIFNETNGGSSAIVTTSLLMAIFTFSIIEIFLIIAILFPVIEQL